MAAYGFPPDLDEPGIVSRLFEKYAEMAEASKSQRYARIFFEQWAMEPNRQLTTDDLQVAQVSGRVCNGFEGLLFGALVPWKTHYELCADENDIIVTMKRKVLIAGRGTFFSVLSRRGAHAMRRLDSHF